MLPSPVFIVGAARTPIGRYGGAFRDVHPAELGAVAARAALERATVAAELVDGVTIGHARAAGGGARRRGDDRTRAAGGVRAEPGAPGGPTRGPRGPRAGDNDQQGVR